MRPGWASGRHSRATSPTVQANRHRGEHDVRDDDPPRDGAVRPVLELPDSHLNEQDREQAGAAAYEPRIAGSSRPGPARQQEEDDPERRDGANVKPDRRVERPETLRDRRPGAAREPARRGRERPGHDEHAHSREHDRSCRARRRGQRGPAAAHRPRRLEQHEHAETEDGEREQQMREHQVRIEVVVDGDRPERSLGERAREDARREQLSTATETTRPPGARGERERRQDGEEGDDAVRELDVRVVALRQRVRGVARGPMRAAEPGSGQAHGRAGGDDEHEHPGRGHGEPPESPRREDERATPRQHLRDRLDVHDGSLIRSAKLTLT